jgi:hypothetical protein
LAFVIQQHSLAVVEQTNNGNKTLLTLVLDEIRYYVPPHFGGVSFGTATK